MRLNAQLAAKPSIKFGFSNKDSWLVSPNMPKRNGGLTINRMPMKLRKIEKIVLRTSGSERKTAASSAVQIGDVKNIDWASLRLIRLIAW